MNKTGIMTAILIKQFEEALKNIDNVSPEKLQELIQGTLAVFQDLQKRVTSSDPEEREHAIGDAFELKRALEAQARALAQSVGMNSDQLTRFVENPSNFSTEDWQMMGETKHQLTEFQQELRDSLGAPKVKTTPKGKKKVQTRADWISG